MNHKARLFRITAVLSLAVLACASCISWQPTTQPLPEVLATHQHIRVTTTEGTRFEMQGGEAGQAVLIRVEGEELVGPLGTGATSISISDIESVETVKTSAGRNAGRFALVVLAVGVAIYEILDSVTIGPFVSR